MINTSTELNKNSCWVHPMQVWTWSKPIKIALL